MSETEYATILGLLCLIVMNTSEGPIAKGMWAIAAVASVLTWFALSGGWL